MVVSVRRELQASDQLHVGFDLRLLLARRTRAEPLGDVSQDRASRIRPGRDDLLGPRRAPVARDRAIESPAQLPPIPISDRIEPSTIAQCGRIAPLIIREAANERFEVGLDLLERAL